MFDIYFKTLEDMNINLLDCKSWKDTSVTWLDYCTKRDDTLGAVMRLKDYLDFQRKTQYSPLVLLIVLIILITFFSKMFIFSSYYR